MILLKVLKLIWPFIKEMIIGKNSLRYAIRKNRIRVAFFFAVILSFVINWVAVPKLFIISANYIKLEQELKITKEKMAEFTSDKEMVETAKGELILLRAKVKELEAKKSNISETKNGQNNEINLAANNNVDNKSKHNIDQIRSRLNTLKD